MVYARPKLPLRNIPGSGVLLNIEWFKEDPGDDRDILPDFHGQALIPAPSVESVTEEMIEDAIASKVPEAEAELAPPPQPRAPVRAMLGKVYDAGQIATKAQMRRAENGTRE